MKYSEPTCFKLKKLAFTFLMQDLLDNISVCTCGGILGRKSYDFVSCYGEERL